MRSQFLVRRLHEVFREVLRIDADRQCVAKLRGNEQAKEPNMPQLNYIIALTPRDLDEHERGEELHVRPQGLRRLFVPCFVISRRALGLGACKCIDMLSKCDCCVPNHKVIQEEY